MLNTFVTKKIMVLKFENGGFANPFLSVVLRETVNSSCYVIFSSSTICFLNSVTMSKHITSKQLFLLKPNDFRSFHI